jgi:hypothetical protein
VFFVNYSATLALSSLPLLFLLLHVRRCICHHCQRSMPQKELLWGPGRTTSNGKRAIHSSLKKKIDLLSSKECKVYTAKLLYVCDSMARYGRFVSNLLRSALIRIIRYMSYVWNNSVGKHEDALNILKEGIKANPTRLAFRSL